MNMLSIGDSLTVVIPFRNGHQTLGRLLDSLPDNLPVIVVDDGSQPPLHVDTTDPERTNVKVIRRAERGYFSGAVNTGIAAAGEKDVLVLNQDVWFDGSVGHQKNLINFILEKRGEFAMIGDGVFGHPAFPKGYVQGTAMFLRRDAIERIGALNGRDYPLWGATAEWQLRMCRAGYRALPVRMQDYGVHHARGDAKFGSSIAATLREEPERESLFVRTPPAISVIITCYNYGRFLKDAVHSLIGGPTTLGDMPPQTLQSFEVIIVDDASTDDTAQIAAELADPWKGIHFLHLPKNVGSAAAANAGILKAHGKYITVLDADDLMEPTRLETLYRVAEQNPHSVDRKSVV